MVGWGVLLVKEICETFEITFDAIYFFPTAAKIDWVILFESVLIQFNDSFPTLFSCTGSGLFSVMDFSEKGTKHCLSDPAA